MDGQHPLGHRRFDLLREAISSRPDRWRARVLLQAPAAAVMDLVPATVGVVEVVDDQRCLLVSDSDSLDSMALLDVPFTPLEPPELRERCAVLADRLGQASG